MKKLNKILAIIGFLTVMIGTVVTIMHKPYGKALLISGLIIYFSSIVTSYFTKNKLPKN